MPPRRRVRRSVPLPPTTPKRSLPETSDSSSSSPDPLDVISDRGSPSSARHSVYIRPGQGKENRNRGSEQSSSSRSDSTGQESEVEEEQTEIKSTRNRSPERSHSHHQESASVGQNDQETKKSAGEEEAGSEDEWDSFRFDNDKERRDQALRNNTGFSDKSISVDDDSSELPAGSPIFLGPVEDQVKSEDPMTDNDMNGEGNLEEEEKATAQGEEKDDQEDHDAQVPLASEHPFSTEEESSALDTQDESEAQKEEITGGQNEQDEIDTAIGEHVAEETGPEAGIDTSRIELQGTSDEVQHLAVDIAPVGSDPTTINLDDQMHASPTTEQLPVKIGEMDTPPAGMKAVGLAHPDVERKQDQEMGDGVTREKSFARSPSSAPLALTDEEKKVIGPANEITESVIAGADHEMDAADVAVEPEAEAPASTPAPSAGGLEEGEEEIDPDTAPTPEADEAEPDIDGDVEMDGSSVPADPEVLKAEVKIRKKPGPKPKPKLPGTGTGQKVEAAAKKSAKGVKGKPKVDELKSSSKTKTARFTPESNYPSSASIASSSSKPADRDDPDPSSDRTYCLCRKKESEDDEDVLMVGCESCDDWFHAACVGLTEDQVENLDVYICRSCERGTKQKTVYKKACKRDGCDKGLGLRESKFCSDLCAYKHFRAFTDTITNKKTLKALSTSFGSFPKPAPIQVIHHAEMKPTATDDQTQQLISDVQGQLSVTSAALEIVRKRQQILQLAIDRAENLAPIIVQAEEGRTGKGRRKGGGGPTEDKQCGWDPRVVWDDEAVQSWAEGQEEAGEGGLCGLAKRRCDKHQGWQKTVAFSLETEERQLTQKHDELENQKESLVKSVESTMESEKARSEFRERLVAKGRA